MIDMSRRARLRDSYDALTESDIRVLEESIGQTLPLDYRAHLLRHNGGRYGSSATYVRPGWNPEKDCVGVERLFAIDYDANENDIMWMRENTDIPEEYLPVADSSGNPICIGLRGATYGRIYILDHESAFTANREIASSFSEFIENIYYDTCLDHFDETSVPFTYAERGDIEAVRDWLSRDGNVDVMNDFGQTLLMIAAFEEHDHIVKLLLEHHPQLDVQDHDGNTALIHAAKGQSLDSCKLLLGAGANCHIKNLKGETARDRAYAIRHNRLVTLLSKYV